MSQQKMSRQRKKELLTRLKEQMGPMKKNLYIVALFSYVQFLMRVLSFALIAKAFEQLYVGQTVDLWRMAVIILGLNGIGLMSAVFAKKYQGRVSQYARNQLKQQFFEAFQLKQGEFGDYSTADVLTVASQGIDSLDLYYGVYLNQTLRAYLNGLTILGIVFFIFPLGSLIFLISLPLIPVSIILVQKRSKQIMQHYWATYMDVGNLFMDDLKGLNTLYTYQADEAYEKTFVEKAEAFRLSTMELLKFQLQSVGYMDAVMYVGVGISGFFASVAFANQQLSLFSVVFFVLIASEFFTPIREAGYGMHLVMMNTKMADRIFSFLDFVKEDKEQPLLSETSIKSINDIHVDNVTFAYEKNTVLNDVQVHIKAGEMFAIAGVSGRGKTTLAKLLLKQLPLQKGDILLNGISIAQLTQEEIYKHIVYISPDNYLFNDTILANLSYGNQLTKQDIINWMNVEQTLQFVDDLPDGLDTVIGENGQLLSMGQRQQLICVRAMLSQFSVFVFDEMTSSVDKDNEAIIFDLMRKLSQQRVVLFISHKMKQVCQADRVLFMNDVNQTIVGAPAELLQTQPTFKRLLETQQELEEILNEK